MQDEVRAAGGANELEPDVPAGDTERALRKRTGLVSLKHDKALSDPVGLL